MSLDLDPVAVESVLRGQRERDAVASFFVILASLFVGLAVAALLWWVAGQDLRSNTIYTAIATGIDFGVVLLAVAYQYAEIRAGKHIVLPVARKAAELFEVLLILLVAAGLNEAWAYGTGDNVLAYAVPAIVFALVWVAYKIVKDRRIRAHAVAVHLDSHDHLYLEEAEQVVDAWLDHQERTQHVYPSLISVFSLPLTGVSGASEPKAKKRRRAASTPRFR